MKKLLLGAVVALSIAGSAFADNQANPQQPAQPQAAANMDANQPQANPNQAQVQKPVRPAKRRHPQQNMNQ